MIIQDFPKYHFISEIELKYKPSIKLSYLPKFETTRDVYKLFMKFWDKDKIEFVEQFKVMLMRSSKVIGICTLGTGSVDKAIIDPKLVFGLALKANASNIIVAHNHPSGRLQPSQSDIAATEKLSAAGKLLEITVNDHFIITNEGYYSFAEEGVL